MIYTVTFNPSLDYIVSVENFQLDLPIEPVRDAFAGRQGN